MKHLSIQRKRKKAPNLFGEHSLSSGERTGNSPNSVASTSLLKEGCKPNDSRGFRGYCLLSFAQFGRKKDIPRSYNQDQSKKISSYLNGLERPAIDGDSPVRKRNWSLRQCFSSTTRLEKSCGNTPRL